MDYLLREMTIDDIPSVIEGETRAFGESLGYDMIYTDLTLNPFAHYIVLEIDKEVHGYISFWTSDNADIVNFYVDSEYRGMGFGEELLAFTIEVVKMSNIKYLSLEVRRSNKVAISLYEKFGFKKSHERKAYYSNGEDAIVYIKEFEVE